MAEQFLSTKFMTYMFFNLVFLNDLFIFANLQTGKLKVKDMLARNHLQLTAIIL